MAIERNLARRMIEYRSDPVCGCITSCKALERRLGVTKSIQAKWIGCR